MSSYSHLTLVCSKWLFAVLSVFLHIEEGGHTLLSHHRLHCEDLAGSDRRCRRCNRTSVFHFCDRIFEQCRRVLRSRKAVHAYIRFCQKTPASASLISSVHPCSLSSFRDGIRIFSLFPSAQNAGRQTLDKVLLSYVLCLQIHSFLPHG